MQINLAGGKKTLSVWLNVCICFFFWNWIDLKHYSFYTLDFLSVVYFNNHYNKMIKPTFFPQSFSHLIKSRVSMFLPDVGLFAQIIMVCLFSGNVIFISEETHWCHRDFCLTCHFAYNQLYMTRVANSSIQCLFYVLADPASPGFCSHWKDRQQGKVWGTWVPLQGKLAQSYMSIWDECSQRLLNQHKWQKRNNCITLVISPQHLQNNVHVMQPTSQLPLLSSLR